MQESLNSKIIFFILSLFGNLSLVTVFLSALVYPENHILFLSSTSFLIYFFEFLSLHSAGMFSGMQMTENSGLQFVRENKKIELELLGKKFSFLAINLVLVTIYLFFAIAYALAYKNWIMAGMFFISVLSKWLAKKSLSQEETGRLAILVMVFLFSTVLIIPMQGWLKAYFPILKPLIVKGSGLFQEVPQTLLAWGAIYFSLCIFVESYFFNKSLKALQVSKYYRLLFVLICVLFFWFYLNKVLG